jgi:probable HAF family extracellular repeat protein
MRWVAGQGVQDLGVLPGTDVFNETWSVDATGRTIVGWGTDGLQERGWVWREGLGMSALPGEAQLGVTRAFGVSGDGRFVVGRSADQDYRAVRWDLVTQSYVLLPVLPGYDAFTPYGVSDDGRTIAGMASTGAGQDAFVWREGEGMFFLRDYLAMNGVGVPADLTIFTFAGLSADGRTFAGHGTTREPGAFPQGFVATVPAPSAALLMTFAGVLASRRRR